MVAGPGVSFYIFHPCFVMSSSGVASSSADFASICRWAHKMYRNILSQLLNALCSTYGTSRYSSLCPATSVLLHRVVHGWHHAYPRLSTVLEDDRLSMSSGLALSPCRIFRYEVVSEPVRVSAFQGSASIWGLDVYRWHWCPKWLLPIAPFALWPGSCFGIPSKQEVQTHKYHLRECQSLLYHTD